MLSLGFNEILGNGFGAEGMQALAEGLGRGALHWACLHGQAKVVDWLLRRGCDPFPKDHQGRSPASILMK